MGLDIVLSPGVKKRADIIVIADARAPQFSPSEVMKPVLCMRRFVGD
jgi:hypothetical protein